MTARAEVYDAIDTERTYQQTKWGCDKVHSPLEFLVYMRDYIEEAMHLCSREDDGDIGLRTLDSVRKITALGVVCMEQHGAPFRLNR